MSKETHLRLINATPQGLRTAVSHVDSGDFDGDSRPDKNFHDSVIPAYSHKQERQEINTWHRSARYTMQMQLDDGDSFCFRNDQRDACQSTIPRPVGHSSYDLWPSGKHRLSQTVRNGKTNVFCLFPVLWDSSRWMSQLPDDRLLSSLSIPGSHDSCAVGVIGPAEAQKLDLTKQLESGVRFFDMRCRHIKNVFTMHHGDVFLGIGFDDVLEKFVAFLNMFPGETILMSVKEEHKREKCTRTFADTFLTYAKKFADVLHIATTMPRLGEVRGKVVLLRRFEGLKDCGIDLSDWPDNEHFEKANAAGVTYNVQDLYKVDSACDNKVRQVETAMQEAMNSKDPSKLFINFSSGSMGFWGAVGGQNPHEIAEIVNPRILPTLQDSLEHGPRGQHGRLGVLVMDYIDAGFTDHIIQLNFR